MEKVEIQPRDRRDTEGISSRSPLQQIHNDKPAEHISEQPAGKRHFILPERRLFFIPYQLMRKNVIRLIAKVTVMSEVGARSPKSSAQAHPNIRSESANR